MQARISTKEVPGGILATAKLPNGLEFTSLVPFEQYAALAGPGDIDELGRFGSRFKKFVKKVAKSKVVKGLKKVGPIIKRGIAAIPVVGPVIDGGIDAAKAVAKVVHKKKGAAGVRKFRAHLKAAALVRKAQGSRGRVLSAKARKRRDFVRKLKALRDRAKKGDQRALAALRKIAMRYKGAKRKQALAKLKVLARRAKAGDKHAKARVVAVATAHRAKKKPTARNRASAAKARAHLKKVEASAKVIKRSGNTAIVRVPSGRQYRVQRAA